MTARRDDAKVDQAAEDSFPANDLPASGITGPRIPRVKSDKRDADARPEGTPADERHANETAYQWEHEARPGGR